LKTKRNDDDFIGVYHPYPKEAPSHWKRAQAAEQARQRAQDPWFKAYWKKVRDYCRGRLN
tara:strand:+ start:392 stop:571 length:180 start_codon:yes stop_codon:yes gene_type:complete